MEEFTNQERSLFLRFVWGRTRLPRNIADFRGRDFVLQGEFKDTGLFLILILLELFSTVLDKYNPADHFLPESYTCFFLLKMPRYSCKVKQLLIFCYSICNDPLYSGNRQFYWKSSNTPSISVNQLTLMNMLAFPLRWVTQLAPQRAKITQISNR